MSRLTREMAVGIGFAPPPIPAAPAAPAAVVRVKPGELAELGIDEGVFAALPVPNAHPARTTSRSAWRTCPSLTTTRTTYEPTETAPASRRALGTTQGPARIHPTSSARALCGGRALARFEPVKFTCCINSCICYTSPYADLDECPNCKTSRLNESGRARRMFSYMPLIPRLHALMSNCTYATQLQYRADEHAKTRTPGTITDILLGSS
jgi:hypothetical protein